MNSSRGWIRDIFYTVLTSMFYSCIFLSFFLKRVFFAVYLARPLPYPGTINTTPSPQAYPNSRGGHRGPFNSLPCYECVALVRADYIPSYNPATQDGTVSYGTVSLFFLGTFWSFSFSAPFALDPRTPGSELRSKMDTAASRQRYAEAEQYRFRLEELIEERALASEKEQHASPKQVSPGV